MVKFINNNKSLIQAISFWILLIFLIGFGSGLLVSKEIWKYKANEVTKVGAVLIGGKIYDVKLRP